MEWLGRAKITFTHSAAPLILEKNDGSSTDLASICKESTPPCYLNPLLFNGHLQTMWTALKHDGPPVYYKRKLFEAENPAYHGSFAVDFVTRPFSESDDTLPPRTTYFSEDEFSEITSEDNRPMLVVLHGLSGGCAMHKVTSNILYNARATWDCRQTVNWLRKTFPNRPLFGIGFSLGANILINYLGEEGPACELKAAVVCSNPWNLEISSRGMQRSWIGMEVYSKTMGSSMKRLIELHRDQVSKNKKIDLEKIRSVKYLHEFDRAVQVPSWGYPTEGAYYRDASSTDSLLASRVPIFAINARDDPIAVDEALPYLEVQQTPYAVLCATTLGGHLSWFEFPEGISWPPKLSWPPKISWPPKLSGNRWYAKPVLTPSVVCYYSLLAKRYRLSIF
ncbi:hypothetical protein OIDMADRAFT_135143 [Oidiodendron maius Zn]|uniref:AB hydrolase-1 domain-containing protein n=1 Tax=Oidiodendron maius (strain Zn) TaxID=913774 RepID=A0A0C3GU70_OIDMZ|nr:hypothetical protein OIDMADRAFT_135143 [Oidiodendron maius Zn]